MNIVGFVGIALIAAILSIVLKKYNPEYSIVLSIITGIFLFAKIFTYLISIISSVKGLLNFSNVPADFILIMFKSLGICFLTQFSSDSCIDAGETALASKIEFIGKIAVVLVAMPLIEEIIKVVTKLIG